MSGYSGSHGFDDENRPLGHGALDQSTINKALADAEAARSGGASASSHGASRNPSSYEPDRPGITRKDTTTRRDPLTGDLIEEYSGKDESGPAMRAHYNWDEPEKNPNTTGGAYRSGGTYHSSDQRPAPVQRVNTITSYDASGNRVEEHDGEGSLRVRALWNDDEDTSNVYNPNSGRPSGPARRQSEQSGRY